MRHAVLASLVATCPVAISAQPLTFNAALQHARANAPVLVAKARRMDAARAARSAAGALPDPTLGVGLDSFPISWPLAFQPTRDTFTWVKVEASQAIPNLAKRHAEQARADADIRAVEADAAVGARDVAVSAGLAWVDLAYAERRVSAIDQVLRRLNAIVHTAPSAVASGSARPAQTVAGDEAVAKIQDRRSELVAGVAKARAALTRWTGDPEPEIAGEVPDFPIRAAAFEGAIDRHPTIKMAAAREGQAEADVRVAESTRRSDFGVNFAYQRRDPRFGDYVSAGVTIGLPIFTRHRQNAQIAARQADASAAVAEQAEARRMLAAALAADLADHRMHHEQWVRARDTLQPLAEKRVGLETASFAAGRASLIDIVDAHAALADAVLTTLDREAAVVRDGVRINLSYGDDSQ